MVALMVPAWIVLLVVCASVAVYCLWITRNGDRSPVLFGKRSSGV